MTNQRGRWPGEKRNERERAREGLSERLCEGGTKKKNGSGIAHFCASHGTKFGQSSPSAEYQNQCVLWEAVRVGLPWGSLCPPLRGPEHVGPGGTGTSSCSSSRLEPKEIQELSCGLDSALCVPTWAGGTPGTPPRAESWALLASVSFLWDTLACNSVKSVDSLLLRAGTMILSCWPL